MPKIRDGIIEPLSFGELKKVFRDIDGYLRSGHIPGWALELRNAGLKDNEIMPEVILQISELAIDTHDRLKLESAKENNQTLF